MKPTGSKLFRKLGALKVYGDVARYYLSLAQFFLILGGFLKIMKFGFFINVIIVVGTVFITILLVYFHVKYIMPNEYYYMNLRNPATMKLLKNTGDGKID